MPVKRSKILVVPFNEPGLAKQVMEGVGRYADLHGSWDISARWITGWAFAPVPDIGHWRGDGAIYPVSSQKELKQLRRKRRPFVNITAYSIPNTVTNDNPAIGRLGAEYLLERGFRHFAFLGLPRLIYARERCEAFRAKLAQVGLGCAVNMSENTPAHKWSWPVLVKDLSRWLMSLPRPLAVMASNDVRARQLVEAATEAGFKVPDEIAILGVDNDTAICLTTTPQLSSIELNGEQLGFQAAQLLDQLMQGQQPPDQPILIPPIRVVERSSTMHIAYPDSDVVEAMRFIRDHANKAIHVSDVIDALATSRRTLERRFEMHVGHSPWEAIRRAQIEHAKKLLVETDWELGAVARATAFKTAKRLGEIFRQHTCDTPRGFRKARGI